MTTNKTIGRTIFAGKLHHWLRLAASFIFSFVAFAVICDAFAREPHRGLIAFIQPTQENDSHFWDIKKGDIWTVKVNGKDLKQLTTGGECTTLSWTPDGNQIVFTFKGQVWIMDYNGKRKQQLTYLKDWRCYWPAVSGDGKKIAFTAVRSINDWGGLRHFVL